MKRAAASLIVILCVTFLKIGTLSAAAFNTLTIKESIADLNETISNWEKGEVPLPCPQCQLSPQQIKADEEFVQDLREIRELQKKLLVATIIKSYVAYKDAMASLSAAKNPESCIKAIELLKESLAMNPENDLAAKALEKVLSIKP